MEERNVQPFTTVFGWEGDRGLGEKLIQQILRGEKTATCAPKEAYTEEELREIDESVGKGVTVLDKHHQPRCHIRMKEVFETPFGNPDPRLVAGEGNGEDVRQFQEDHRQAWAEEIAKGFHLHDQTVLLVELFELEK
ncbi:ASCH domain-containing protein [Paludifilum halophilum]|uniref:ASCH domain-containing protein n=1 Tax=Paludifilum halophilum TaxID=1642702 RepID=A0A235B9M9_9BACL|nr:ASCH domain-containing protein [Paludifilum halophilum]OYD08994.1 hypothetical protein CHM34_04260 [Paludifilum halophilum]